MNELNDYLSKEFHIDFADILFNAHTLTMDFVSRSQHLLIDARNYPQTLETKLLHPQEIMSYIPPGAFYEYANLAIEHIKLMVYLYPNGILFYYRDGRDDDKFGDTQEEVHKYINAYKHGLIKEAFTKIEKNKEYVVFTIIDGVAKLVNHKEAINLLERYDPVLVEEFITICVEENNNYLSFLYINTQEDTIWYDILQEDYFNELRRELFHE
jgi:hypothetical protein